MPRGKSCRTERWIDYVKFIQQRDGCTFREALKKASCSKGSAGVSVGEMSGSGVCRGRPRRVGRPRKGSRRAPSKTRCVRRTSRSRSSSRRRR